MDYPFTRCLNPRRIKHPCTGEPLVVPCCHCEACMQNKSARLAFQCECECKVHKYNLLVTLTYANTYVPRMRSFESKLAPSGGSFNYKMFDVTTPRCESDFSLGYIGDVRYDPDSYKKLIKKCHLFGDIPYLRKKDLQLFIKRLRSYLPEYEIRYFGCGEYGPDSFRPHLHIILSCDDSELIEPSSYCTMSEFPQWTWPKKKEHIIHPEDRISFLEYYIRQAWSYGIVDCELVSAGSASTYVAGYVNGSQPLPPFLKIPASRCFAVHSRFLGGALFRKELAQVLSTPVEEFVKGSLEIGSKSRDYTLRYSNYRYYYPKCKGYAVADSSRRLQLYQSYDTARSCFGYGKSLIELARELTNVVAMYFDTDYLPNSNIVGLSLSQIYESKAIELASLLYPFRDVLKYCMERPVSNDKSYECWVPSLFREDFEKVTFCIYNQLIVSRTFCENCRILNVSPQWYLSRIEDFYRTLDYMHLTEWYEAQSAYFDEDFADEGDVVYFYNNVDYDFDNFKNSLSFRAFECDVKKRAKDLVKHKLQNDKNKIFE